MDSIELVGAIVTASGIIAGALKLLARDLARAISKHGQQVQAHTAALDRNTEALTDNTAAKTPAPIAPAGRRAGLMLAALALLPLAGCAGTPDPLVIQAMERHRTIWQEDRRPDLPEDLQAAREREFAAGIRYAQSGGR